MDMARVRVRDRDVVVRKVELLELQ